MPIKIESTVIIIFLISLIEFVFLIPIYIYLKHKKLNSKKYFKDIFIIKLKSRQNIIYCLLSYNIAIAMIFIAPYIIIFLRNSLIYFFGTSALQQAQENLNEITFVIQNPLEIIIIVIMSFLIIGLNEELFFRWFLLKVMKLPRNWKIITSSFFFSLYHLITSFNIYSFIYMFLYYFIWGLILSIEFYICKKQVIFPILTHGLFDFILYLL
ncbi:MAG: CPBP family intramembrane glutamic endopeptidase [Candidatus Helarchaeota archaeon]